MMGWKLFRLRKDGSLGPLFINRKQRLYVGETYMAEDHPTKGFAHRPGWHVCAKKEAPHLSKKGRVWAKVQVHGLTFHLRPASQGGLWATAQKMKILSVDASPM